MSIKCHPPKIGGPSNSVLTHFIRNLHTQQVVSDILSMVFSDDDRDVIEACYLGKRWGARRILKEFPERNWNLSSVTYEIKKIKDTGSTRIGNKAVADQGQRSMMTIRPT